MDKQYTKSLIFDLKSVDTENYIIRGVFSTAAVDRHGEIVDQTGWKLAEYMLNPVILFAHDQYQPAVGKMIELSTDTGQLEGAIQFAVEEYEFARTIFNLYVGGFMKAFSVGFNNDKFEYNESEDQVILRENTLFEVSCVNVPANALALAKSKGIDIAPIEKKMERASTINAKIISKTFDTADHKTDNVINTDTAVDFLKNLDIEAIKSAKGELEKVLTAKLKAEESTNSEQSISSKKKTRKAVKRSINKAITALLKEKQTL